MLGSAPSRGCAETPLLRAGLQAGWRMWQQSHPTGSPETGSASLAVQTAPIAKGLGFPHCSRWCALVVHRHRAGRCAWRAPHLSTVRESSTTVQAHEVQRVCPCCSMRAAHLPPPTEACDRGKTAPWCRELVLRAAFLEWKRNRGSDANPADRTSWPARESIRRCLSQVPDPHWPRPQQQHYRCWSRQ